MADTSPQKPPAEAVEDVLALVRSVLRRSKRYWPVLAVSVILSAIAAWVAPKIRMPLYSSEVVLQFKEGLDSRSGLGEDSVSESPRNRSSRVREFIFSAPTLTELVEAERISPNSVARLGMARVLVDIRQQIQFSGGEGRNIGITFTDSDAALAQRAARRLGEILLRHENAATAERAAERRTFLQAEKDKVLGELSLREAQYAAFITDHPEFAPERSAGGRLTPPGGLPQTQPSGSSKQGVTAALLRQQDRLRRRLEQIRNPNAVPTGPVTPPEPEYTPEAREAIAAATNARDQARAEYDALRAKYTPLHPDVARAQAKLTAAEDKLRAARASALRTARQPTSPLPVSTRPPDPNEEQNLVRQLRQVELDLRRVGALPSPQPDGKGERTDSPVTITVVDVEREWAEISRSLEMLREQHEEAERRLYKAVALDNAYRYGGGTELVVIQAAYLPNLPSARGARRTSAAAAGLFLLVGVSLMLGLGFLDQRILSEWDLAQLKIAPVSVVIPGYGDGKSPKHV